MVFVDEIKLYAKAGSGGDGVVRWRRLKGLSKGGPFGGDGGKGGDVYIEAVPEITILEKYRGNTEFTAEDGQDGASGIKKGKAGEDITIRLPVGSFVVVEETGEEFDLILPGEKHKILKGGAGGYGNAHFKSSTNTTPKKATKGKKGQESVISVELRLLAHFGLVGVPNAGKTSLLNALTKTKAKTADYPFTTLEPNLGVFDGLLIADIPGLIEGASLGKGLGHKFLKHIKRTKTLIFCISVERDNILEEYKLLKKELLSYSSDLAQKNEIILLTKTDLISTQELNKKISKLKGEFEKVLPVSVYDKNLLENLKRELIPFATNH